MSLQLHLPERKPFPIGSISVADRQAYRIDNIRWDSLAQRWFRLYKLRSPSANLLAYTKLLNRTAGSHAKKSPPASLHGRYPQPTMRNPLNS